MTDGSITPTRIEADLERGREYIEHARPRVHVAPAPQNLTDALFGPYTCKRCCSYLHTDDDHGEPR